LGCASVIAIFLASFFTSGAVFGILTPRAAINNLNFGIAVFNSAWSFTN
jgi:hypothetical protein